MLTFEDAKKVADEIQPLSIVQNNQFFKEHYKKESPFLKVIIKEGRSIYTKNAIQEWLR